jgi:hypothetical protein
MAAFLQTSACLSTRLKAIIRSPKNYYVNVHNAPSPTAQSEAT